MLSNQDFVQEAPTSDSKAKKPVIKESKEQMLSWGWRWNMDHGWDAQTLGLPERTVSAMSLSQVKL
jgi:hypothetical protein